MENRYSNNTKIRSGDIERIKKHFDSSIQRPKILIIFTDRDEDRNTEAEIEKAVSRFEFDEKVILAIPDRNFEKWIIADIKAISKTLKSTVTRPKESTEAKKWLSQRIGDLLPGQDYHKVRNKIVRELRINVITQNSFTQFSRSLNSSVIKLSPFVKKKPVRSKLSKKLNLQVRKLLKNKRPLPKDMRRN